MKNTIVLTALSVLLLPACSQQPKNDQPELTESIMTAPPSQASVTFTDGQLKRLRDIMKDEAAKAVGAVHLDLIASGKIFVPNTDPTYINGVPVANIDHENSRYYREEMNKCRKVLCKKWGVCDTTNFEWAIPKLRYKGYDYLISFTPSHYVLELECMTSSLSFSVVDPETGKRLEDLWFTVDEKQKLTQPNPAELAYTGRVSYTRFNEKSQIGTPIPDYGISTLRLSQLLKLMPEVIERGEVVRV